MHESTVHLLVSIEGGDSDSSNASESRWLLIEQTGFIQSRWSEIFDSLVHIGNIMLAYFAGNLHVPS